MYNWETNKTTNRYDVDFNPDLPGMKYVADIAANSMQMKFLNREVKKFLTKLVDFTVVTSRKRIRVSTMKSYLKLSTMTAIEKT